MAVGRRAKEVSPLFEVRLAPVHPASRVAALALGAALTLAGCGGDGGAGSESVSRRDSSGVEIVENPAIDAVPECRLAAEPRLDIGAVDGPAEFVFHRVSDATRLPDGRIAVVDGGNREVRVFGGDGGYVRSLGQEGEGPGDFRAPLWLWQRGDTLAVYDGEMQRVSWFSSEGQHLRQVRLRPPAPGANRAFLLADGRIVASVVDFRPAKSGFRPQPLHLVLHGSDGQALDTVGQYVWRRLGEVGPEGASFVTGPVFEPRARVSAGGSRIFVGTGVDRKVEVLQPDGTLARLVRWSGGDRSVSGRSVELFRSREFDEVSTGPDSAAVRQRLDERPVADRFPTLDRLRVGRDGRLWVRRFQRPSWEDVQRWIVFGEDGALRCRLEMSGRFSLLEAGFDYVLGTWRDQLDVTHVRLHDLEIP